MMPRRHFLRSLACLLPLPAFLPAARLWLPPERLEVQVLPDAERLEAAFRQHVSDHEDFDCLLVGTMRHFVEELNQERLPGRWTSTAQDWDGLEKLLRTERRQPTGPFSFAPIELGTATGTGIVRA